MGEEIKNVLCEKIEEILCISGVSLDDTSQTLEQLGANSLDRFEIVTLMCEALSLKLTPTEIAKAKTIADIIALFQTKE